MSIYADGPRLEVVTSEAQLLECFALRMEVFVREQRVPVEEELDDADRAPSTVHVLARSASGEVVGTGRLLRDPEHPGVVHIGRIAVAAGARGQGIGAVLMGELERVALAEATGARVRVELSAQEHAFGFYRSLGYRIEGERYLDAGIWHKDAWRELEASPGVGGDA